MDKENDIFDQPSKVQNMNFIFDEETEETASAATQQFQASRTPRTASSDQASVSRARRVSSSASPQRQSAGASSRTSSSQNARSASGQSRSQQAGNPNRSSQNGSAQRRSAQSPQRRTANAGSQNSDPAARSAQAGTRQPQQSRSASGRSTQTRSAQSGSRPASTERTAQSRGSQARPSQNGESRQARTSASRSGQRPSGRTSAHNAQGAPQRHSTEAGRTNRTDRSISAGNTLSGRKKKKRSSGFKKFLLIYSALLLVILIVGAIIFSSFLKSLEGSQPSNIASEIAQNFSADKVSTYLKNNSDLINCFGEPDALIEQVAAKVQNAGQVSYIENSDYRADAPSYNITADGNTVAKVTLVQTGTGPFGVAQWSVASIDVADYVDTNSYEFLAPVGTIITIDGVELDEKYLTGQDIIPEQLQIASKYVPIPSYLSYKVAGIAGSPQIKATDVAGKDLPYTATAEKFVVGAETTQEFIDSVDPLVNSALEAWGKHFINMGGNLSAYMLEGSDWYGYIFGSETMDPIFTSFYEYESIANYTFTEKSTSNYIRYTDSCFTVDVHYKMKIDFNNNTMSDDNQKLDATWVFITQDGGKNWYIIDCLYK